MLVIDRAQGDVLWRLTSEQGEYLADLVDDVQAFQVNSLFLEAMSNDQKLGDLLEVLGQRSQRCPFLMVGLEPVLSASESTWTLEGSLVDRRGHPLGGLVVTAQNAEQEAVSWSFSRSDGSFSLRLGTVNWQQLELLVSGRGGLLLLSFELDELPSDVERLEAFVVPTVGGVVRQSDGRPLEGARLEAWSSWATTDRDGRFLLPVDRTGDELYLEVFAASGQPLGGYWKVIVPESDPYDLGERVVPAPDPNWPDSEQPLLAQHPAVQPLLSGLEGLA